MPKKLTNLVLAGVSLICLVTGRVEAQAPPSATDSSTLPAGPSTDDTAKGAIEKPVFEEWVVLFLDGKQCGYGCQIATQLDTPTGPQFQTTHREEFVVKRLGASLKITETSKITEDADGGVLSFVQTTAGVGSNIESTGVRDGDDLIVSSRGQTKRYHLPRLDALGPEKIRRMSDAVPLKAGQPFSFNTFSSDYPQGVVVETGSIVGPETHNVRGVDRPLWKLTSEASILPGLISTSWVDDKSQDVEDLTVIPGIGDLHEYVTDRIECMKQTEGAEIFATSLLRPQVAIPSPHDQAQAVYRLTLADSTKKISLWNEGEQRVISSQPGSSEVEVTARPIAPGDATWQLPHADTPELHRYLQASAYLEVDSPEIQTLAKQAVGDQKNPVLAAHAIEDFVRSYITKKDLNIGFASAQETARSCEGDCTEHAVLCAALGRAAGLPTRCVVGFGYIPPGVEEPAVTGAVDTDTGIFGFHMWAEAWISPDEWVPMDAALDGFDVGHIAITKTALEEVNPMVDLNAPVLQLMENLKIEVLKTVPKAPPALAPPPDLPSTPASPSTPAPASPATAPTRAIAPAPVRVVPRPPMD